MTKQIEPPIPGQVYAGTGGMRKVVSVKKRSDRMNDYNVEWQRPDNDWCSTEMWLPYWARWVAKAKLVSPEIRDAKRSHYPS